MSTIIATCWNCIYNCKIAQSFVCHEHSFSKYHPPIQYDEPNSRQQESSINIIEHENPDIPNED